MHQENMFGVPTKRQALRLLTELQDALVALSMVVSETKVALQSQPGSLDQPVDEKLMKKLEPKLRDALAKFNLED